MDQATLEIVLTGLPLGALRYFDRLDSTNDEAARWIEAGAPDLALVVADEQIAGKGRAGRRWITPPGSALAFSLVLYPPSLDHGQVDILQRAAALGALAVCEALHRQYGLHAQIKWPNDVLLDDRKVAGILAEAQWTGSRLRAVILGVGVNVAVDSVSEAHLPASSLVFPATSIETSRGAGVDRLDFLRAVLERLLDWLPRLASSQFLNACEDSLAYRGEWIHLVSGGAQAGESPASVLEGKILGLAPDGQLKLRTRSGETVAVRVGEVHLRPAH